MVGRLVFVARGCAHGYLPMFFLYRIRHRQFLVRPFEGGQKVTVIGGKTAPASRLEFLVQAGL